MALSFFDDLSVYREGLLSQGFWALQVYRFGHLRFRYRSKLIRIPLGIAHVILSKLVEILSTITIGVSAKIGARLIIEHPGAIVVHGHTVMGDDCIIRQGVTFGIKNIDRPFDAPVLGNRVNVGAGAKLLGKIHIGDDVDIGANAVVVTDVPSNHIAVGIPAVIKPKKTPPITGTPTK
ncbi:serine O-acetyltransferase [Derxia gummosa]|uniref:Serine acetyltransferase n=1 Tax=Derxia gummosa DSM 723 TaxID=1121388 RepID=A0A8B6X4X3_9BURK|nr:serine acetyltransferase [Derxia gummosa]